MSYWTLIQELYDTGGDPIQLIHREIKGGNTGNQFWADILKRGIDVLEIVCIYIYSIKRAHFDTVNNLFVTRYDTS